VAHVDWINLACQRGKHVYAPLAVAQAVQTKLVSNLGCTHCIRQILLVGKDEEEGVAQFVLIEHALELLTRLRDTLTVVRVNNKDNSLGVLEVWPLAHT